MTPTRTLAAVAAGLSVATLSAGALSAGFPAVAALGLGAASAAGKGAALGALSRRFADRPLARAATVLAADVALTRLTIAGLQGAKSRSSLSRKRTAAMRTMPRRG